MTRLMGIGEFARQVGLSISAIRFYADRGLLAPAEIDPSTGYRSYTEDQVAAGQLVRDLRKIDLPLDNVREALALPPTERRGLIDAHVASLEATAARARTIAGSVTGRADPHMPSERGGLTTIAAAELQFALAQVFPAVGTDPELPHLMCMLIELRHGSLRLAATDSFRLAIRDVVPDVAGTDFRAVVAAATVRPWLDRLRSATDVRLGANATELIVEGTGIDLQARLLPLPFPDYQTVLDDAPHAPACLVERHAFVEALEGLSDKQPVTLNRSGGVLLLGQGDTCISFDVHDRGGDAGVALNRSFGADAARGALGGELVIEFADATSPVTFRSADDGTFTSVLMPVLVH